ncbi:amino acid permease [Agaricicola taiwanensis]|uniref:Amino acid permease n=1 Tax=Agaricicola taiwanensis TaxID=591372 RepID=A0A8J2VLY0_9RHOB|nr:amino acid permease [Agaricicola taiwanensis]GGE32106.1 amino acid permease [Agaricicola taiwanensis]
MATEAKPLASLSVLDGVAIMVGVVVGIGIFRTPPLVAANVGSDAAFIIVWLVGGFAVFIGALCYAELAASHPNVGGEYHFLRSAFGRNMAILFAWARCTVIQPGAIAAVAFVFGDYMQEIMSLGSYGGAIHAAIAVALLTGLNVLGTPQSKTLQIALTTLTLAAVGGVVVAGFVADPAAIPPSESSTGTTGALGMAMVFVLLTYGGWNEAAYMSGELRDAKRTMVRVLVYGTAVIVIAYTAVNLAFLGLLGLDGLRAADAPAAVVMRAAAGEAGVFALSLIVGLASLSTINGTIFTGARAYYALGRDMPQLPGVGDWDDRGDTPLNGLLVQGGLSLALVALGAATRDGFQSMVDFTAPVFWLFMLFVSLSLFVLRRAEPDIERPFKVPLYPVLPALFTLMCAGLLYSSLVYTGVGALMGVAVLIAGIPFLLIGRRQELPKPAE